MSRAYVIAFALLTSVAAFALLAVAAPSGTQGQTVTTASMTPAAAVTAVPSAAAAPTSSGTSVATPATSTTPGAGGGANSAPAAASTPSGGANAANSLPTTGTGSSQHGEPNAAWLLLGALVLLGSGAWIVRSASRR